jgi:predicted secreted protein
MKPAFDLSFHSARRTQRSLWSTLLAGAVLLVGAAPLFAQPTPAGDAAPRESIVTVSGSATASVANDRLRANLRAEAEHNSAAAAASEVNAKIAKALARARGVAGVTPSTSGYSSYQITQRDRPARWRVSQSLTLEGRDFAAMTDLVSALQAETGLLLSGVQFSISDDVQREAEDRLTQQAIRNWQDRAARAAEGLGFAGWRPGRVTVQAGSEVRPPYPMMRAAAAPMADAGAPVAFEAGNSDITVIVSGEAVLETRKPAAR